MFDMRISPKMVGVVLMAAFGLLLIAHVAVAVLRVEFGRDYLYGLALRFDFDRAVSIPDWYKGALLLLASLLSFLNAAAARAEAGLRLHWRSLGALLLFLSFDAVASLHTYLAAWLYSDAVTVFARWTIVYAPVVAVLALLYAPFLASLPRSTAVAIGMSGLLFVAGALGLELVGARIAESATSLPITEVSSAHWFAIKRAWPYVIEVTLEESLEMVGLIVYIVAALGYLSRRGVEFKVSF
jgi:hypothetical protein